MIPTAIIKDTSETALDRQVDSIDTIHEAQIDSEITHEISMIAYAHQAVFALKLDGHFGVMNKYAPVHSYISCHLFDYATHSIYLQIENILHR